MILLPVSPFKQKQQADCLAACCAMVLTYLQTKVSYQRLLRLLKVQTFGSVFHHLKNLEVLGVSVLIDEGDIDTLKHCLSLGLPVIVFVDTGELQSYWVDQTNHAVLVVGLDEAANASGVIYLNDPEFLEAPKHVPLAEFELAWLEKDYLYAVIEKST